MSAPDVFDGEARIIDRGYRKYDGPRTGVNGAVRSVFGHSVARALGLRRTIWPKLFAIGCITFAYLPAVVFVGVVALFPRSDVATEAFLSYGDYYGFVIAAIMVFVAVVAPEVMCTDRRTGMLGVYLAAPLDRDSYLVAKVLSIAAVLALVCMGPPLLLLLANVLQSTGPDGLGEITETALRVIAAGAVITLLYTGITVGITSLTDRKFIAMAAIILVFLMSIAFTGTLYESGMGEGVYGLAPTILSLELAQRVHDEYSPIMPGVSGVIVWFAWAAWTFGGFALARFRLHRLPVTR